jgi:hypothetical protein
MKRTLVPIPVYLALMALALASLGCNGADRPPDEPDQPRAVCLEGAPFVANGDLQVDSLEGEPTSTLGGIRWEAHEGCERIVFDLSGPDNGGAGSPGRIRAEILRDLGVVRIRLEDITDVERDAADRQMDGDLARAAYVVRSPEGRWLFADIHLATAAEVHVSTLADPARVVVDFRQGGEPLPANPAYHDHVVVLQPREGLATYPLTLRGYARTFEANVVARLEQDGQTVKETFTTSTGWVDAWGYYEITIDNGPRGPMVLHVGEYSAKDGSWNGASVQIEMR